MFKKIINDANLKWKLTDCLIIHRYGKLSVNSKIVGDKHIKSVLVGPEGTSLQTIAFNAIESELGAYLLQNNRSAFNIAGKLSLNEWRGQKNVEFIIDDISVNKNIKNVVPSSIG